MNTYYFAQLSADSVDLKCLLINKGVRVEVEVYDRWEGRVRLNRNPLWCNSFLLSDGTNVYLTDMGERGDTPFRIALLPDG
ncbi:MAG: hypothetical protein LBS94_00620, partial [Prevotellaceae bacterium]|nr:hypothetical protein [Prevotellaceae bacterium]